MLVSDKPLILKNAQICQKSKLKDLALCFDATHVFQKATFQNKNNKNAAILLKNKNFLKFLQYMPD